MVRRGLLLIFFLSYLFTSAQQRWEAVIGEPVVDDYIFSKDISYDGGILVGNQKPEVRELIKTNKKGVELWSKTLISNSSFLNFAKVLQTDNQVLLGGGIGQHPFLVSLNSCFEVSWCVKFQNENIESGFVKDLAIFNNQIIALTYLNPIDQNNKTDRIYLFCFDLQGNFL